MKTLLSLLLIMLVFVSCEKLDEPDILGTYSSNPDGCSSDDSTFLGCEKFIILSAGGVADVLLGGDMISRTTYKIKGQKIKIEKNDQFGKELTFKQLNDGSLREESDKTIWHPVVID